MPFGTIEVKYNPDMPKPDKNTRYVPYAGGDITCNFIAVDSHPKGIKLSFVHYNQADKEAIYEASVVGTVTLCKEDAKQLLEDMSNLL